MSSYRDVPERSIEPPEAYYIEASCSHEVYEGEALFLWDGEEICADCLEEKIDALSYEEIAYLLGCEKIVITDPKKRYGDEW